MAKTNVHFICSLRVLILRKWLEVLKSIEKLDIQYIVCLTLPASVLQNFKSTVFTEAWTQRFYTSVSEGKRDLFRHPLWQNSEALICSSILSSNITHRSSRNLHLLHGFLAFYRKRNKKTLIYRLAFCDCGPIFFR